MKKNLYEDIVSKKTKGKKLFSLLIDPDKFNSSEIIDLAESAEVDYFFVGGSLITNGNLELCVEKIKSQSSIPVILFPGNTLQINKKADAILFLSLISGRNPETLIGRHVIAAPVLKSSNLEVIPTGYMLIESGRPTTASYMSNTIPIPSDKNDIAMCTAMAGEMLGLKLIYLDGGSGAQYPVSLSMIGQVKENIDIPLIVGGGIRTPEDARKACMAGADMIVIGNAIEKDKAMLQELADAVHESKTEYI